MARQITEPSKLQVNQRPMQDVADGPERLSSPRSLADGPAPGVARSKVKRTLDLVLAVLMLLLASPLMAVIAIAIRLDSPGGVFFKQRRVGCRGKDFTQWKFRTMVENAVQSGLGVTVADGDSRITRTGRLLRKTSLDELPNLFNVLKGEMSIVGPRPTLRYQVEKYTSLESRRLLAPPGITGLAAVRGRNSLPWARRIEYDLEYIDRWSIWLDMKILCKTFWVAWLRPRGIYGQGGVNDDFGGTPVTAPAPHEDER